MIRATLMGAWEGAKWVLAGYGLFFVVLYNLAVGGKSRKLAYWMVLGILVAAFLGSLLARYG